MRIDPDVRTLQCVMDVENALGNCTYVCRETTDLHKMSFMFI